MEIKGVHELYPYRSLGGVSRTSRGTGETVAASKDSTERDVVRISPEAAFRSKLDAASKSYAEKARNYESGFPQKIQELKEQYKGDNCPVSGQDVARAIMNNVCGIGK